MATAASLGTAERNLLKRLLAAKKPITRTSIRKRELVASLNRLFAAALVWEAPGRRGQPQLQLTGQGRVLAENIARRNPDRLTLKLVYGELLRVADRLDELRSRFPTIQPTNPAALNGSFEHELRSAIGELDRRGRYGGLVPIPELRRALAPLGLSRDDFDRALLEQERAFAVDLKTAHDPTSIEDAKLAVWDEGRGWLYYVVAR